MRLSLARRDIVRALFFGTLWLQLLRIPGACALEPDDAWLKTPIERHAVQSSNLAGVGYDPHLCALEIEFHSGAIYRYRDVPHDIFDGLMKAKSKGQFFVRKIRGRYSFQRMIHAR